MTFIILDYFLIIHASKYIHKLYLGGKGARYPRNCFKSFLTHFKLPRINRSNIRNLEFKIISDLKSNLLVMAFSKDETKKSIQDYDSFKHLGSDNVNFGFIKECWLDL